MASFAGQCEWAYILQFHPLYWSHTGVLRVVSLLAGYPVYIVSDLLGFGNVLALQFALKLPYILADLGVAFLLHRITFAITKNEGLSNILAFSWLLSPLALFYIGVMGRFESLTLFFLLLAILCLIKHKPAFSLVSLTAAACIEYFAFFLLPIFLLYLWRKTTHKEMAVATAGSLAVLGVNFLPQLVDPILRSQLMNSFAFYSTGTVELIIKQWSLWGYPHSTGILYPRQFS